MIRYPPTRLALSWHDLEHHLQGILLRRCLLPEIEKLTHGHDASGTSYEDGPTSLDSRPSSQFYSSPELPDSNLEREFDSEPTEKPSDVEGGRDESSVSSSSESWSTADEGRCSSFTALARQHRSLLSVTSSQPSSSLGITTSSTVSPYLHYPDQRALEIPFSTLSLGESAAPVSASLEAVREIGGAENQKIKSPKTEASSLVCPVYPPLSSSTPDKRYLSRALTMSDPISIEARMRISRFLNHPTGFQQQENSITPGETGARSPNDTSKRKNADVTSGGSDSSRASSKRARASSGGETTVKLDSGKITRGRSNSTPAAGPGSQAAGSPMSSARLYRMAESDSERSPKRPIGSRGKHAAKDARPNLSSKGFRHGPRPAGRDPKSEKPSYDEVVAEAQKVQAHFQEMVAGLGTVYRPEDFGFDRSMANR